MEIIWHEVKPNPADNDARNTLPPLDHTVLICYPDYKGIPMINFGGRTDGGEGWLWGIDEDGQYGGYRYNDKASIMCDDEYLVTRWAEIPWPE